MEHKSTIPSSERHDEKIPNHIKDLYQEYFYNLCIKKNKDNPDKKFCEEEKEYGSFGMPNRTPNEIADIYNLLKIHNHQQEIGEIYKKHGGLIVLRNPLTSGNKTLVVGCGNEPVAAEKYNHSNEKGYAERHAHKGADTINLDPLFNPSLLGSVTDPLHTSYIPDNHYDEVYFEGMVIIAHRGPVFKEMHRILKPGGQFRLGMPSVILVEPVGKETFDESGFIQSWKTLGQFPWTRRNINRLIGSIYEGSGTFLLEQGSNFNDAEQAVKAISDYFKTLGFTKVEIIYNSEKNPTELRVTK